MKTREDFVAAANRAYDGYEKVMFSTAQQMFGIAEPSVAAINEFETQMPIATQITDPYLIFSGEAVAGLLTAGWKLYVDADDRKESVRDGMLGDDDRWIGWMDDPVDLPSQVRLGDQVMSAEWQVLLRYKYQDDVKAISGVTLHAFETAGSRTTFDAIVCAIGGALGTPLAPYQPRASELPPGLLWTGDTVRALLSVIEWPPNPVEGIEAHRAYNLKISRHLAREGPFHLGCDAEQLLR